MLYHQKGSHDSFPNSGGKGSEIVAELIDLKSEFIQPLLPFLLADKTTKKNIVFATDSYADQGEHFAPEHEMKKELLPFLGLKPRILKSQEEQALRTRKKAEVFTPAWLCCKMNNHCDEEWFGKPDVFNHLEGESWTVTKDPVSFPKRKTWKHYVDSRRLEITCGEAPYVVSRYDAATGEPIALENRIGILDRKLRVVNENTTVYADWEKWVIRAFQSVYGYEWQGDSLLIARVNLIMTLAEYYAARWDEETTDKRLDALAKKVANIISWNFWQMDGLKGSSPYGEPKKEFEQMDMFSMMDMMTQPEAAPETSGAGQKNTECRIFDWREDKSVKYSSIRKG